MRNLYQLFHFGKSTPAGPARRFIKLVGNCAMLLISVLLLVAGNRTASANATWWVSGTALAGGTGSQSWPYQTINAANTAAHPGDTIMVETGTYREQVTLKSGTSTSPTTLMGVPGQRAVLSGFTPVTGWATYGGTTYAPPGSVYTTTVNWNPRQLNTNNSRNQLARYPQTTGSWPSIASYNTTTHTITLNAPLGINLTTPLSAFACVFVSTAQNYGIEPIISMTNNGLTIVISPDQYANQIVPGDFLIICNHPSLIANLNDFCYQAINSGTTALYWYPAGGTNNLNYAQSPYYSTPLRTSGSNQVIQGMEIAGGGEGIYAVNTTGVTVNGCLFHDNTLCGAEFITCTNVTLENCVTIDNFNAGVNIQSCSNVTIEQSEIGFNDMDNFDSMQHYPACTSNLVLENCYIHHVGFIGHADNIQTGGVTGLTIQNNLILLGDWITADGFAGTNNVYFSSNSSGLTGGGASNWGMPSGATMSLNYNTFGFSENSNAIYISDTSTYGTVTLLNTVFYRDVMNYNWVTASNYSDMWNGTDIIGSSNTSGTGTYHSYTTTAAIYSALGFEANSTGSAPLFKNAPITQAVTAPNQSTANTLVLQSEAGCSLTGCFNQNDIVEVEGDGVPRTVLSATQANSHVSTITISPALSVPPFRQLVVWDWPAGTNNLVVDLRPASGSPILTSGSGGVQGGSDIDMTAYVQDKLNGGSRNTPVVPGDVDYCIHQLYPYTGILTPIPAVTGGTTYGAVGTAFSYSIQATNYPTSYNATGLPAWANLNTAAGLISGTPTATGTFPVTISASNISGTGSATWTLKIVPKPVITSPLTASGTTGSAFIYQIVASNFPTSYGASGYPTGLNFNSATGLLSGTPTLSATGTFPVTISASNVAGTGTAPLTITIASGAPSITGTLSATGTANNAFSYQIVATNNPISYNASNLPTGLSVSTATGLVSGTPALSATGGWTVPISASNAQGTGTANLALTVVSGTPVITSALSKTGTASYPFSYNITASNNPTSYNATGLPAGLTVSSTTGAITGTLEATGTFYSTISAINASGTGSGTLTITGTGHLLYEGFDYPVINDIQNAPPSSDDIGWSGTCWNTGTNVTNDQVISPGLTYPGMNCIGNALLVNNFTCSRNINMSAMPAWLTGTVSGDPTVRIGNPGTTLWFRILISPQTADTSGTLNGGYQLTGAAGHGRTKLTVGATGTLTGGANSYWSVTNNYAGTITSATSSIPVTTGGTVCLVVQVQFNSGVGTDIVNLYVNPPMGSSPPATPSASMTTATVDPFDTVQFIGSIKDYMDEFSMATDWGDL